MKTIDIHIKDDHLATVNIKNDLGANSVKTIPIESLVTLLSKKQNHFTTGIIPPNLVNYAKMGQYTVYHIFVPAHSAKLIHMSHFRHEESNSYMVKFPSMLFSFAYREGSSEMTKSLVHCFDTEEYTSDSSLWNLSFNNYSTGYGVCWGNNKKLVASILKSQNLDDIVRLPYLFLSSPFNSDLTRCFSFKASFKDKIAKWSRDQDFQDSSIRGINVDSDIYSEWFFKYMYDNDVSYFMSMILDEEPTHDNLTTFINNFNNGFIVKD